MTSDLSQPGHGFAPRRTCRVRATCQPVAKGPTIDGAHVTHIAGSHANLGVDNGHIGLHTGRM